MKGDEYVDSTGEVEFDGICDLLVRGLRESFRTLTEQENTGNSRSEMDVGKKHINSDLGI